MECSLEIRMNEEKFTASLLFCSIKLLLSNGILIKCYFVSSEATMASSALYWLHCLIFSLDKMAGRSFNLLVITKLPRTSLEWSLFVYNYRNNLGTFSQDCQLWSQWKRGGKTRCRRWSRWDQIFIKRLIRRGNYCCSDLIWGFKFD